MRKTILLLFVALIIPVSCQKSGFIVDEPVSSECAATPSDFAVSSDEAFRMAHEFLNESQTKGVDDVMENLDYDGKQVAYYVNFAKGGWAIVSGDKRMPAILAYSRTGSFDPDNLREGPSVWMEDVLTRLNYLKENGNVLTDSPHIRFWNKKPAMNTGIMTKRGGDEHEGEWLQQVYVLRDFDTVCDVDHLIETRWSQCSPWNACLPLNSLGVRAFASCATVALAQLSYYLHFEIGKPGVAPAAAQFVGSNYFPAEYVYGSFSSNIWNLMPKSLSEVSGTKPTSYVAALYAYIYDICGYSTALQFDDTTLGSLSVPYNGFGTNSESNVKDFLDDMSISYSGFSALDPETICLNISDGLPVFASSSTSSIRGYAWLIDGALKVCTYDVIYSQWMPFGTFPPVEPEEPDWNHPENYEISEPVLTNTYYLFQMNWGDGVNDSAMYYYGDPWNIDKPTWAFDPYQASTALTNRKILYNFH